MNGKIVRLLLWVNRVLKRTFLTATKSLQFGQCRNDDVWGLELAQWLEQTIAIYCDPKNRFRSTRELGFQRHLVLCHQRIVLSPDFVRDHFDNSTRNRLVLDYVFLQLGPALNLC